MNLVEKWAWPFMREQIDGESCDLNRKTNEYSKLSSNMKIHVSEL